MKVMNPDHNTLACYAILTKLLQEICKLGFKYGMSRPDCDALAVSSSFPRAMVYPPAPPADGGKPRLCQCSFDSGTGEALTWYSLQLTELDGGYLGISALRAASYHALNTTRIPCFDLSSSSITKASSVFATNTASYLLVGVRSSSTSPPPTTFGTHITALHHETIYNHRLSGVPIHVRDQRSGWLATSSQDSSKHQWQKHHLSLEDTQPPQGAI
jgi:hypothetical protein